MKAATPVEGVVERIRRVHWAAPRVSPQNLACACRVSMMTRSSPCAPNLFELAGREADPDSVALLVHHDLPELAGLSGSACVTSPVVGEGCSGRYVQFAFPRGDEAVAHAWLPDRNCTECGLRSPRRQNQIESSRPSAGTGVIRAVRLSWEKVSSFPVAERCER